MGVAFAAYKLYGYLRPIEEDQKQLIGSPTDVSNINFEPGVVFEEKILSLDELISYSNKIQKKKKSN